MDGMRKLLFLGIALGILESMVVPAWWPVKLGLANIATLYAAATGIRAAVAVAVTRSLVVCAATGSLLAPSGLFSLAGGVASALVMASLGRLPVSLVLLSVTGGIASAVVQVGVFGIVSGVRIETILPLLPWFSTWGLATGFGTGVLASRLLALRRSQSLAVDGVAAAPEVCTWGEVWPRPRVSSDRRPAVGACHGG